MPIGIYGPEYVQFAGGGPARKVPVHVFLPGTKIHAQLYADRTGLYTGPNPVWTDDRGELLFFAESGQYDLHYERGNVTWQATATDSGVISVENPVVDWFTGQGPPPAVIVGAGPGDMYVDTLTGMIYQLR